MDEILRAMFDESARPTEPEPDWNRLTERMSVLTMRELKPVMRYFTGMFGGVSSKSERISIMVGQMRHWWLFFPTVENLKRIHDVLKELETVEFFKEGA